MTTPRNKIPDVVEGEKHIYNSFEQFRAEVFPDSYARQDNITSLKILALALSDSIIENLMRSKSEATDS